MDPTLKTRIIAALRESARCARSPEQQNEAIALAEALCEEDMAPNVVIDLGGAGDGEPAVPAAPDALRKAAQAEVDAAEKGAYARAAGRPINKPRTGDDK